jgi:pyruvate dehydrogenase E2 component (dihydrolipoamide acetyltransferase)
MVVRMNYKLVIPALAGLGELRVLQWHKAEGDSITVDQLLVELETDRAVVEVRSPRACVLRKIDVRQSDWVQVGPPLAWLTDSADEALDADKAADFMPHWEIV